jgi:hypothetical protein
MKTLTLLLAGSFFLLAIPAAQAQPNAAKMTQNALFYADSLIKVDSMEDYSAYANLTPVSVIKYYGGKEGFIELIRVTRQRTTSTIAEQSPELKMLQLLNVVNDEWQCVIRESRYFHKLDQKYSLVTYFVGQSKDGGETWRLFDVSYNKVANIIAMFPEVFGDLEIKEAVIQNSK